MSKESYSSAKNILTIFSAAGPHVVVGKPKGTFIKAEYDNDSCELHKGSDNEYQWVDTVDDSATFEVTLQRYSASNAYLTALEKTKREFSMGATNVASEGTVAAGTGCRILKIPAMEDGDKPSATVVWRIQAARAIITLGKAKESGISIGGITL